MNRIGIYSPARGLGSTLLAAHLYYYLREHGVRCCAQSHGFRGERPLGLARWQDIPEVPREPVCFGTLPRLPLGMGVDVLDLHAELFAHELGEHHCDQWVIPIRDEASLERGLELAARWSRRAILVWNGAEEEVRRRVSLPFGRIRVAENALPISDLLREADEQATPIWQLPGSENSSAAEAMLRVLHEILGDRAGALDAARRVPGGQPPMPAPCGACMLCDYYKEKPRTAA